MGVYGLVCLAVCMGVFTRMFAWVYAWMCSRVCAWVCAYKCVLCVCMHVYTHICVCMHACYTHAHSLLIWFHLQGACHSLALCFRLHSNYSKPLQTNPNQLGSHHTQAWGCQTWVLADVSAGIQRTDRGFVPEKGSSLPSSSALAQPWEKRVVTVNQ